MENVKVYFIKRNELFEERIKAKEPISCITIIAEIEFGRYGMEQVGSFVELLCEYFDGKKYWNYHLSKGGCVSQENFKKLLCNGNGLLFMSDNGHVQKVNDWHLAEKKKEMYEKKGVVMKKNDTPLLYRFLDRDTSFFNMDEINVLIRVNNGVVFLDRNVFGTHMICFLDTEQMKMFKHFLLMKKIEVVELDTLDKLPMH